MRFYDPLIASDCRIDEDLENLVYFGTARVVTICHAPRQFEGPSEILSYFESQLSTEVQRLRRFGLDPHVALGVHPRAAPRRAYPELWRELPMLLSEPPIVAMGELGLWQGDEDEYLLLEHQLRLACELNLPAIVRLSSNNNAIAKQALAVVRRSGIARSRVLLTGVLNQACFSLIEAGFAVALSIDNSNVDVVTKVLENNNKDFARRLLLTAALREGRGDVLSMMRASLSLRDAGVNTHAIERLTYGNALSFYHAVT